MAEPRRIKRPPTSPITERLGKKSPPPRRQAPVALSEGLQRYGKPVHYAYQSQDTAGFYCVGPDFTYRITHTPSGFRIEQIENPGTTNETTTKTVDYDVDPITLELT
jgi:hypothetical protein